MSSDAAEPTSNGSDTSRPGWESTIANALAFARRRLTGDYEVDEFGYDAELAHSVLAPPLRVLYEKWFRVELRGLEHIPAAGGALIAANHSGVVPLDGAMLALAISDHKRRTLRMLAADLLFQTPFLGEAARKSGVTLACPADAEQLLTRGHLVGVFPEGFKGIGKNYRDRYQLQRFGRGGFVASALKTGAPIVPCAIVGAEEIYPMIADAKPLARLLGLPYFPITPLFPWLGPLGMIPLPSRWIIEFCPPIDVEALPGIDPDDPTALLHLTDQVRETIQHTLDALVVDRGPAFGPSDPDPAPGSSPL